MIGKEFELVKLKLKDLNFERLKELCGFCRRMLEMLVVFVEGEKKIKLGVENRPTL